MYPKHVTILLVFSVLSNTHTRHVCYDNTINDNIITKYVLDNYYIMYYIILRRHSISSLT